MLTSRLFYNDARVGSDVLSGLKYLHVVKRAGVTGELLPRRTSVRTLRH